MNNGMHDVTDVTPVREHTHRVPPTMASIFAVVMILLALIGAVATLANASFAEKYWLYLVPVFGVICSIAAWCQTGRLDRAVIRQILHWSAVGIAIAVDFTFLHRSGEQTATGTGLTSLLLLALGCLLAGIHLEWMFALVGLLLLFTAIIVSVAQEYMALVIVIGLILIAAIAGIHYLTRKWRT